MARGRSFIAAGDHPAGMKRRDAQRIDGVIHRPVQKLGARGGDSESAANRAGPPAVREELWRVDAEPHARDGFVTDNRSFEKPAAGSVKFLRRRNQRRNNHGADASSRAAVNIVHLAAMRSNGHRLNGVQIRNSPGGSKERRS